MDAINTQLGFNMASDTGAGQKIAWRADATAKNTGSVSATDPTRIDRELPVGSPTFCQCVGCGRHFRNGSSFDHHQRLNKDDGSVICRDPATIGQVIVWQRGQAWWSRYTEPNPRFADKDDE